MRKTAKKSTARTLARFIGLAGLCALGIATLTGCPKPVAPEAPKARWHPIPADPNMPPFLKETIKDLTVSGNTGTFPVSSYGLVIGLRGTGDCAAPSIVREWMIKEMIRHKINSPSSAYKDITPEQMLNDPRVAIVQVIANIPPGARKDDQVDIAVAALPENNTSSLANGNLWLTTLKYQGTQDPFGAVHEFAVAQGNVLVNPAYATSSKTPQASIKASLRTGIIPNGGIVSTDRPMHLILRNPSWSGSRMIERRINYRFQTTDPFKNPTAASQDEGYIHLFVPKAYKGNWQHFLGVATHLYMNADGNYSSLKAKELADEAIKPDAPLMDISYAWEGIGQAAVPYLTPLLTSPRQDVQFAAARAAAFIGDQFGENTLVQIAGTPNHPFQVNAVETLGELPGSLQIGDALAALLDSKESLVRIEAYKVLSSHQSQRIFTQAIHSRLNPDNEFLMDIVESKGPPMIYCSRLGKPRIAIFGHRIAVKTPLTFAAFDSTLTISNLIDRPHMLDLFYRESGRQSVEAISSPDLAELIARLGGSTDQGFHFTYGDMVAILQGMTAKQQIPAAFVLQQLPGVEREIQESPSLPDQGRPQADAGNHGRIGASLPDMPMPVIPKEGDAPKEEKKNDINKASVRPQ